MLNALENKKHAGPSQLCTQGTGTGGDTRLPKPGAPTIKKRPPAGMVQIRPLQILKLWRPITEVFPFFHFQSSSQDSLCPLSFLQALQRNSRFDLLGLEKRRERN